MNWAIRRQRMNLLEFDRAYSPPRRNELMPIRRDDEHGQTGQHRDDKKGIVNHGSSFLVPRDLGAACKRL
jgi:hypothetical protein